MIDLTDGTDEQFRKTIKQMFLEEIERSLEIVIDFKTLFGSMRLDKALKDGMTEEEMRKYIRNPALMVYENEKN